MGCRLPLPTRRNSSTVANSTIEVPEMLREILDQASSPMFPMERRDHRRYPYPSLIEIRALDTQGGLVDDPATMVIGKHLSASGIGFFHEGPMAHKRIMATFLTPQQQAWSVVVELLWCRFVKHGWYDSGGRFVFRQDLPESADSGFVERFELPTHKKNDRFQ